MKMALVLMVLASTANAQEKQPAQPPAQQPAQPATGSAPSDFNFDLSKPGEEKNGVVQSEAEKLRLQKLEHKVHLRRRMLLAHQAFGFATLAALAATDIIGTLHYVDKFGGGPDDDRYKDAHLGLGITSTALFTTTALLALFAPNPYPKPIKFDTAFVHKASMAIAAACFVAQVIMGPLSAVSDGKLYQKNLALAHEVVGWGAFGFMTIGTIVYLVK
jgi:hypothetical protein